MNENVTTTGTTIAEYSQTEQALATLRDKYKGVVFEVTTTKGMTAAKDARAELRGLRTTLEKKRQEIKAPALERCRAIDSEAKRITAELSALEDPIDETIKIEEHRKEEERLAKLEAERQRVQAIQDKIDAMRNLPATLVGKPAVIVQGQLAKLRAQALSGNEYQEFIETAADAHTAAIARIEEQLKAQQDHEAEQARIKAEREELDRLREADRVRREEEERRAAEARAEQERQDRERREREEAEHQARLEAEARERAEREAAERAEREEREAEERRQREEQEEIARQQRAAAEQARREEEARQRAEEEARMQAERERLAAERRQFEECQAQEARVVEARRQAAIAAQRKRWKNRTVVEGAAMTDSELNALLSLLMCDDPSSISEEQRTVLADWADAEARRHGFNDWLDAYHGLEAAA